MKMKKTAIAGVLTGAALLAGGVMATVASADVPGLNIGNNSCIAPWMWNGPGLVGVTGQTNTYEACNGGSSASSTEGINIGNDACILPWNWNGPLNVMLSGNTSTYASCN